jgi:retron-type reverse transcriptase
MRRVGNLWPELISWSNLYASARAAARGKRRRPDVARFFLDLEPNVARLRRELVDRTYQPGPYRVFTVHDPKQRRISAAPFRDRVVHHALTRMIEPVFERRFTRDSYACRKGYGTHRALRHAHGAAGRHRHVLKCDVVKFFPSIDHELLLDLLRRKIKCEPTLWLARTIIEGSNPQEPHVVYFPGDDLFTPHQRRRGLPIGNQSSQFFANVSLDPLDHAVREVLRPADYVRYADDFLLFDDHPTRLVEMLEQVRAVLAGLRLVVHPRKSRIYRTSDGFPFLGWQVSSSRLRLARRNVIAFKRRGRLMQHDFASGRLDAAGVRARLRAWIAHAAHGDTWRLRERVLEDLVFTKGCGA